MEIRELAGKVWSAYKENMDAIEQDDFCDVAAGLGFESPVEYIEANLKENYSFTHRLLKDLISMYETNESPLCLETINDLIDFGIEMELAEVSADCVAEGYPSGGYNYDLRADQVREWWHESYPEFY